MVYLRKCVYFIGVLVLCSVSEVMSQSNSARISYELRMSEPHSHYFEVGMILEDIQTLPSVKSQGFVEIKMPVWTPGSYLEREYAKNVEGFTASSSKKLKTEKVSKNTWRVYTEGAARVTVNYKVYCYELSVRNAYLDDSHAYLNGAAVFMFVPGLTEKKSYLSVFPHESFKKVSVALPEVAPNKFEVENFDLLVDSPFEIGNHEIIEFEALGVKHKIANYSNIKIDYDTKKLIADYKKVVEAAASVVGEHPCKNYLFIVHHMPNSGGGLEHLNSTTCQTSTGVYKTEATYRSFMGLIAHEYFHLWNVKRIRPFALGPFNYEKENYSHMLWVSEGFTSFYQDDILRRADMMSEELFTGYLASKINSIENVPGNKVQSVAESSFDAWIKYYRPNENSNNSTVSYYNKGGVLANIINLIILKETKAEKSLDDVFRYLWTEYYKKKDVGYTDEQFQQACEKVAGISLKSFFEKHIYDTEAIDYQKYYAYAGLELVDEKAEDNLPYFGALVRTGSGTVTRVDKGSGAYENGIYVNDEIISVDGKDFEGIAQCTKNKSVGDSVLIKLKRSGKIMEYNIPLKKNPEVRYVLKKMDKVNKDQEKVYQKMVHSK
ncbi:PDZ domain-containing protein [Emticicia sp. CRIBPO]|uniref:M61 family metallopeptidase n=1 Tax=Emticicia sp. CRIBPO TaxID=2683258 RepID=UPI00141286E4|nr:PDZ domain-containing protein [Emticicia sp. CRIBPO]NBA87666.1 PDZ domain-containing protein [Emticicia sp. CRIBPO]